MSSSRGYWMSFDLGIDGDYNGLYRWLDSKGARECGLNMAYIKPEYDGNDELLIKSQLIKTELENAVKIRETDRIYLIFFDGKQHRGKFIIGKRKPSPWEGFSVGEFDEEDDSEG